MFFNAIAHSFLLTTLFCGSSSAARRSLQSGPVRRQDSTANSTAATLQPVIPPDVNEGALDILALDTSVTLAWADASSGSTSRRMRKRDDGALYSSAAFTFRYPVIPLDHSTYVSNVACNAGSLAGTLTSKAYSFAKKQWSDAGEIVFVTSVDGCGMNNANELFLATSIQFSDSDYTFTATGSPTEYKEAVDHMNLKWGNSGSTNLKRAADKRSIFETTSLQRRHTVDIYADWGIWAEDYFEVDDEAPWENAAILFQWGTEGGEEDDSYEKGEVASADGHHKRSNETSLATRGDAELSYGLALYCVHCGFGGSIDIWGEIDADIWTLSINTVQTGITASFEAGLTLGMQAFVKYEKTWEDEIARIDFAGFDIPLLVSVGPFASVSIEATAGIEATGSLLIGAGIEWNAIDVMLDLLDSDNSYANGFEPTFSHTAEASGELKISASLGVPLKLGIGISVLEGVWEADAAIVDTPSVVAEGSFEVSAEVTDDGTIEYDINGGCYGIAWDVHFENTLQAVIEADYIGSLSWDLIDPMESDPIAEGCIGYVDSGANDDEKEPNGMSDGTGMNGNGNYYSSSSSFAVSSAPATGVVEFLVKDFKTPAPTPESKVTKTTLSFPVTHTTQTTPTTTSPGTTLKTKTSSKKTTKTTSTPTKKATTTTPEPTCTPTKAILNPKPPTGSTCKKAVKKAAVSSKNELGGTTTVKNQSLCAAQCLKKTKCQSFSYDSGSCQLYKKAVDDLAITKKKGEPQLTFYDKGCYKYKACS